MIGVEGKDLAEPHEVKGAAHARDKGADGKFSGEGFCALIIFDQGGQTRGVDIGHGGEVQKELGCFIFRFLAESRAQFGGLIEIDLPRERENGDRIRNFFLDLHCENHMGLWDEPQAQREKF